MKTKAINPHWVGNHPAWDIILPDGTVDKDVIDTMITSTGVVRECHIQAYGKQRMLIKESRRLNKNNPK